MRREGRVRGKPANKSRLTERCKSGKTRCRQCRNHPVEKSRQKRMGRYKRFAVDVRTNPAHADLILQPPLAQLRGGLDDHEDERWCSPFDTDESILVATVNSMIEAAFAKLHDNWGDECEMDETTAMAYTTYELANGAAILASVDGSDIAAIELAFQRDLGIFENAVEGSSFSHFVRKIRGSTLSEESWSDVDLLESEQESSADDDWSIVDVDEDSEI